MPLPIIRRGQSGQAQEQGGNHWCGYLQFGGWYWGINLVEGGQTLAAQTHSGTYTGGSYDPARNGYSPAYNVTTDGIVTIPAQATAQGHCTALYHDPANSCTEQDYLDQQIPVNERHLYAKQVPYDFIIGCLDADPSILFTQPTNEDSENYIDVTVVTPGQDAPELSFAWYRGSSLGYDATNPATYGSYIGSTRSLINQPVGYEYTCVITVNECYQIDPEFDPDWWECYPMCDEVVHDFANMALNPDPTWSGEITVPVPADVCPEDVIELGFNEAEPTTPGTIYASSDIDFITPLGSLALTANPTPTVPGYDYNYTAEIPELAQGSYIARFTTLGQVDNANVDILFDVGDCEPPEPVVLDVSINPVTACPEDVIAVTSSHNLISATLNGVNPLTLTPTGANTYTLIVPSLPSNTAYFIRFETDAEIDTTIDDVDFATGDCAPPPEGCVPPTPVACFDTLNSIRLVPILAVHFPLCTTNLKFQTKPLDGAWTDAQTGIVANLEYIIPTTASLGMKGRLVSDDGTPSAEIDLDVCTCEDGGGGVDPDLSIPAVPSPPILTKDCEAETIEVTAPTFSTIENAETVSIQIRRKALPDGEWVENVKTFTEPETWEDPNIFPATAYEYQAKACNAKGCSAWSTSATVTLVSPSLTMVFTQPDQDSSLNDVTELLVELTDAGESDTPECDDPPVTFKSYFAGNLFELNWELVSGTWRNGVYRAYWDAREFGAGSEDLVVTANGRDGCRAKATLSVVLGGMFDVLQACWWSKLLPTAELEESWPMEDSKGNNRYLHRVTASIIQPTRSSDDSENYVYRLFTNVPGTSTDLGNYQLLDDKRHAVYLEEGQTVRVAMCREPLLTRNKIKLGSVGSAHAIRLHKHTVDSTQKVAVLTRNPNQLLVLEDSTVSVVRDLSGDSDIGDLSNYQVNDVAYFDGRYYVAMEPVVGAPSGLVPILYVVDLTEGELDYSLHIGLPEDRVRALAVIAGVLWVGTDNDDGVGRAYTFDAANKKRPVPLDIDGEPIPGIVRLWSSEQAEPALSEPILIAATREGKLYSLQYSEAILLHDSGEVGSTKIGYGDGLVEYLGGAGVLYTNRGDDWAAERTFSGWGAVQALAKYQDRVHAGGDTNELYQRRNGVWIKVDELTNTTSINDMVPYGQGLVIATSNGGNEAFLHTRRVSRVKGTIAREIPHVAFGFELKS